jgi:hypothetical protein
MNQDLPRRPRVAVGVATVMGLGAAVIGVAVVVGATDDDRTPPVIDPGSVALVSYDTCESALQGLKSAALSQVGPYGFGGYGVIEDGVAVADGKAAAPGAEARDAEAAPDAAPPGEAQSSGSEGQSAAQPHSGTNNYESDVDEPDIVKTDGRRVVSIADGRLRVVDVASHKQTALVTLPGYASQLLLDGDRALVVISSGGMVEPMPRGEKPGIAPGEPAPDGSTPPIEDPAPPYGSQLVLVDLTGAGSIRGTLTVEGSYLDARQVGSVARVVVRSMPRLEFTYPEGARTPADAAAANRGVVESSSMSDWLPRYHLPAAGKQSSGELLECSAVSHPKRYTGTAMLTILTVDLAKQLGTGDPMGIAADGDTVYGTGTNLYVADDHFARGMTDIRPSGPAPAAGRTEIYQFDISGAGKPKHVASGAVPGSLLSQYSLSEHEGNLRVATTIAGDSSRSMVNVLARKGKALAQVGRVDGLGKGERIYAVRFLGATAYVVTFRQTDPLYTVDLADPAKPRVTGELKITGYSAYLHPMGDGRLLGIGQEATTQGQTTGTQISLFDTGDQRGAKRLGQLQYEGGHSDVEYDPHAFLYWPEKKLAVLPMTTMTPDPSGQYPEAGALVVKVGDRTLTEVGMVRHVDARGGMPFMPHRALVIGDELWTVSEAGILVNNLDTLRELAWLPAI